MHNIFDDQSIAVAQLINDKHTLLEGYVTERLFYNQFLKDNSNNTPYTKGWWMATHNNTRFIFVIKEELTYLDICIRDKIKNHSQWWHVYLKDKEFIFSNGEYKLSEEEFISRNRLIRFRSNMIATEGTRDEDRQRKSIDFFIENGIIKDIATERKFANNFLTAYYKGMVNIDYLTEKNSTINIIEVKFKFESNDGYFGINTGQMEMFRFFMELGFNIYHFILYNHTKSKYLSIFGFIDLDKDRYWYYSKINTLISYDVAIAPEYTSVSGGFQQNYYKLSMDEFKKNRLKFTKI